MPKKGVSDLVWVIAVVAILFGVGVLHYNGQGFSTSSPTTQTQTVTPGGQTTSQQASTFLCNNGGSTNPLYVSDQNTLLTAGGTVYQSAPVAVIGSDGRLLATGTTTAGSTLSYTTVNVPCGANANGFVYLTAGNGNTVNSARLPYDVASKLNDYAQFTQGNVSGLYLAMYGNTNSNTSALDGGVVGTIQTATESAATAMGAGSVRSGYIFLSVSNATSQFGSTDGGIIFAIDTVDSSVFSDNAISLSSANIALTPITCPASEVSMHSANRCYSAPAIKTSNGNIRIDWTMNADLGNPGASADPVLYIDDVQYFQQNSGVVQGTATSANSDVGAPVETVTWNNS